MRVRREVIAHVPPNVFSPFQEHLQSHNQWTYSHHGTCFWRDCNAAWPFRGRPSSGHAVATLAMHTAIKLRVPQCIRSWQDTPFYN